jgi:hypothetical protein
VALPLLSVFIASLYFHSTISKLAQTSPYLTQFIKKRGRGFLPPLTSVPFGAPTNAPRFKQIVFGRSAQRFNQPHHFWPLLFF